MLLWIFILILVICIWGIKRGSAELSYYVIEKIVDPEIINYCTPRYCTDYKHATLKIPEYENATEYEEYDWDLRRSKIKYILPVIPVLSDFLSAYWFVKKNKYKEIILLSPYHT
jgi:hypothetical protein